MLIGLAVPILSFFFDEDIDGCSNSSKGLKKNIDLNIKLTDEVGSDIIFKDLVKELNLVYFGYSFCPDICPIDLGRNVEVNYALNKNNKQFATFFVTVDPLRDTPERLREYTDLLDDSLVGLTGSIKQIEIAKKNFMVYGSKSSSDQNYLVDHSTFTYLINC